MEVPAGAARCPNCGAPQGRVEPCPHCNAQAGTSPDHEFRFVCDGCGGPRVPRVDPSIAWSGREAPLLRKADAARKARAGWRAAAIASGLLLPFVLLVIGALLLIFGISVGLVIATLFALAPIGAFLAFAIGRAGARGREIAPAIDAAWLSVATEIAQQVGPMSAATLAQKLGIAEPQAEELMALIDVNESIAPAPRVRIGAPPGTTTAALGALSVQPTQIAAAVDEAAIIEQAAAEAEAQRRKGTL
jgi:hypothetical protein